MINFTWQFRSGEDKYTEQFNDEIHGEELYVDESTGEEQYDEKRFEDEQVREEIIEKKQVKKAVPERRYDEVKDTFESGDFRSEVPEEVEEEITISDCLLDLKALELMTQAVKSHDYNVSDIEIRVGYEDARRFLAYSKSLLQKYYSSSSSADDVPPSARNQLIDFIDRCRSEWEKKAADGGTPGELDLDNYFTDSQSSSLFYEDVQDIKEYYKNERRYPPYYIFERMVSKISPLSKERRILVKMSKYAYRYSARQGEKNLLTCQMVLSDASYGSFSNAAKNEIVAFTEETINKYLSSSIGGDKGQDFNDAMNSMITCINSCDKAGNHNFGQFIGKKQKCFGLFDVNPERYISLSGPFDVTDNVIESYLQFDFSKQQSNKDLMRKIKDIIMKDPILSGSKYSNLIGQTCRYSYPGKKIPNGKETVSDAINRNVPPNEIGSDFTCCERKILAQVPATTGKICYLFTRHLPCPKCEPAIQEWINKTGCSLKIYYLHNDIITEKK